MRKKGKRKEERTKGRKRKEGTEGGIEERNERIKEKPKF